MTLVSGDHVKTSVRYRDLLSYEDTYGHFTCIAIAGSFFPNVEGSCFLDRQNLSCVPLVPAKYLTSCFWSIVNDSVFFMRFHKP